METCLVKPEIVWMEEGRYEVMLPLKQEDCKQEDIPDSVDYVQSSEEGIEENIYTSERLQFVAVKCEKVSEDEIHETADDLDVEEDIIIIEDENPLTSSSEEHQSPSLAAPQIRVIDTRAIQKRIETSSGLDSVIVEVSYPNSGKEGEKSYSGEGQNITNKGKERSSSSQCNRSLIVSAGEKKPAEMRTNANNCEGGNLSHTEKIIGNGRKRRDYSRLKCDTVSNSMQERPEFCCKKCGVFFSNVQSYKRHNISNHNDRTFTCNECGIVFLEQSVLDSHMIGHTADRPYSCFICKNSFRRIRTLRLHLQCHEGKAKFPCEVCDEIFDSISALKHHLISHTGKEDPP